MIRLPRSSPVAAPRARAWLRAGFAATVLAAVSPPLAQGSVFKCVGEGGVPVYQGAPCPAGRELRNFSDDPPPLSVLPGKTTGTVRAAPDEARAAGADVRATKGAKPAKSSRRGDAAERAHLRAGMSQGEVLARLGEPDTRAGGKGNRHARWTYLPAPGDPETITTLIVANGVLVEIDRKVVKK
jgi:hypothetical protein